MNIKENTDIIVLDILTKAYAAADIGEDERQALTASLTEFVQSDDDRKVLLDFCKMLLAPIHEQLEKR